MSGARAGIERIYTALEQRALGPEQAAALTGLAARVRELTEAVVFTDVGTDEVEAVAAEVAALTERLSAARREESPVADLGVGHPVSLANPVTGPINPIAPPVDIELLPNGTARAEFTLSAIHEGPPLFVHGGISALILDQLLSTAAAAGGQRGMTATLDLRYRRPTPYGVPLVAEAKGRGTDGRKSFAEARINGPDGRTTVEATAMFVIPRH